MAVDQSFLDGLRAQANMGMGNYTRTAQARSADQNQSQSGNPYTANNMSPPSWQQIALQRQQAMASLAQDPTNIRYVAPTLQSLQQQQQQTQNMSAAMPQRFNRGIGATNQTMPVSPNNSAQFVRPMPVGTNPHYLMNGAGGNRFIRPMAR